jgi:hypothetical protein
MGSWATCARRVGALSGQETHLRHSVTTRMWTVDVPAKSVPAFARARRARRSFWARSLLRLPRARTLSGKAALPHVSALPRPASVQDLEDLKRFTHRTQLNNSSPPMPNSFVQEQVSVVLCSLCSACDGSSWTSGPRAMAPNEREWEEKQPLPQAERGCQHHLNPTAWR